MERISSRNHKTSALLAFPFFILSSVFYSGLTQSNTPTLPAGTQLAFFLGHNADPGGYERPGDLYYNSRYRMRSFYRTTWSDIGHGCQESCLIDRWGGKTINCKKRCMQTRHSKMK